MKRIREVRKEPLLDNLSRSEIQMMKQWAVRSMIFSMLGIAALLITWGCAEEKVLLVQSCIFRTLVVLGGASFGIGGMGLLISRYFKQNKESEG